MLNIEDIDIQYLMHTSYYYWDKTTVFCAKFSFAFANSYTHTHTHTAGGMCSLLFLCNQLSEQDAWWERLLADAKSLVMLCGEVK